MLALAEGIRNLIDDHAGLGLKQLRDRAGGQAVSSETSLTVTGVSTLAVIVVLLSVRRGVRA